MLHILGFIVLLGLIFLLIKFASFVFQAFISALARIGFVPFVLLFVILFILEGLRRI
jgi:hypothetical protein